MKTLKERYEQLDESPDVQQKKVLKSVRKKYDAILDDVYEFLKTRDVEGVDDMDFQDVSDALEPTFIELSRFITEH